MVRQEARTRYTFEVDGIESEACVLVHEGTGTIVSLKTWDWHIRRPIEAPPVRSLTIRFSARGRGLRQDFNNNKRKLKVARRRQFLTGDHLVNETREVRKANSTGARLCSTSVYRIIIWTAEVTIGIIL